MEKETDTDKILRAIAKIYDIMATKDDLARMATKDDLARLEARMDDGFTEINRRLDKVLQPDIDALAHRVKKLEEAVFSG